MNDYTRHAYRRVILAELRRHLADRFLAQGSPPAKAELLCEEVFYVDRLVPEESFFEVLELLERLELAERSTMMGFEMRQKDPSPAAPAPKKPRPRRRPKAPPAPDEGEHTE
ncbi:hypothetical protein LVJ94_35310 [Pendulispora rubella]|uniref:Uncharacterized protein n=1 Tax=Pendulispora rubella TaxID=2741070 RepID=A0ABZ2L0Q6_9BACT